DTIYNATIINNTNLVIASKGHSLGVCASENRSACRSAFARNGLPVICTVNGETPGAVHRNNRARGLVANAPGGDGAASYARDVGRASCIPPVGKSNAHLAAFRVNHVVTRTGAFGHFPFTGQRLRVLFEHV